MSFHKITTRPLPGNQGPAFQAHALQIILFEPFTYEANVIFGSIIIVSLHIPISNHSNRILYTVSHMWSQKWGAVQLWFSLNFKPYRTTHVTAKIRCGAIMVLAKPHHKVEKPKIWNIYQFQIIQIASYTPYRICDRKNEVQCNYGFR